MQSNQLVNFANEFDFLPDLARVAAAEVLRRWPGMGIAQAKALAAAGDASAPALSPPPPTPPAFCTAALGPRDGAVWAAGRGRAAPRGAGRGRGASRRWQVGVTLGPSLAPAARSAVREPRGAAAPRSAQRPPRRSGWQTAAAAGAGDGPPGRSQPPDVPCVRAQRAP